MKKSVMGAAVAGLALAFAGATSIAPAMAQTGSENAAPVILIVDQARLIASSKAGQSINEQLLTLQNTANAELEVEVEKLVKEQEALKVQRGKIPEDQFLEKAKRLAVAQNNVPVLREIKVRELSLSEQRAVQVITNEMRPILKEIVDQRGATILLDRSAVMYANTTSDITDEVLAKLDAKLTSVKVERISLAAGAAANAPQQ